MQTPAFLKKFYKGWMAFSHVLGRIMSTIVLTVLWIVGFGIYGIARKIGRLFGMKTYKGEWLDCHKEDASTMKYQF